ncbi:4'-phosphopantetheinyl transferase family protein [Ideonella paludis]|uniref:4'-phosphopantetheinyl transferase superfamily protein n=1 Tax=Ideonella paludis TaxID=1233411 RepID=A0ABS5DS39_9BURK|nr:4'-phosphopantetheinyl transferase superfamily protein [Ideonella paludis]MBQ0933961.1 4'-phosphopantetheinyl transferase superfamily protein [Ideonella paludis]
MSGAGDCWLAAAATQQLPVSYRPSPEEALRAATLPAQRAAQFLTGRWLLRELLTEIDPGRCITDWDITVPSEAAPQLRSRLRQPPYLSVSHSRHQVLVAVCAQDVGVDIEVPVAGRDRSALAALVCPELPALTAAAAVPKPHGFYLLWTLKEAWLKRGGLGVSPGLLQALRVRPAQPEDELVARAWSGGEGCLSVVCSAALQIRWSTQFNRPAEWADAGTWALDDLTVSPT